MKKKYNLFIYILLNSMTEKL